MMWDFLYRYAQQHPRWYEPLDRYHSDPELLSVHRRLVPDRWPLERRGLWYMVNPPDAVLVAQGWKIHVSTMPENAVETLELCVPILLSHNVPYKFLLDRRCVELTSAKRAGRSSSGKFITVYPASDELFLLLAKELAVQLADFVGPHILSDRPVPGSRAVFYRYGGFLADSRLQADGVPSMVLRAPDGSDYPDVRPPYYSTPPWAADPFGADDPDPDVPQLDDGRFAVESAIMFSNAGGVYLGTDHADGSQVVIKEARPGVVAGNSTAVDALRKEYRLLRKLAHTGHFVTPRRLFEQGGHVFLVEDFVSGPQMSTRAIATNPLHVIDLHGDALRTYYRAQQRWWLQLAQAIDTAHRAGVILGDLSFTNVLVDDGPSGADPDRRLVVIDLEAAVEEGVDKPLGLSTPGVSSPRVRAERLVDRAGDWYALGALMLGSVHTVNAVVGYRHAVLDRFLDALETDLALPADLIGLIRDLMDPAASGAGPDPDAVRARIEALDFAAHPGWDLPIPLSLPASAPTAKFQDQVRDAARRCAAGIAASADPARRDRLFPGHALQYESNPYSVAYGASGVMHTLWHLGDDARPGLDLHPRIHSMSVAWLLRSSIRPTNTPPGLYSGLAGVAWVLAEQGEVDAGRALLAEAVRHPGLDASPGVLHGAAGVGMACLRHAIDHRDDEALAWAAQIGERIASSAQGDESGAWWPDGQVDEDGQPLGAPIGYGSGASGVAAFLLYLSLATRDDRWRILGRRALNHDLAQMWPLGPALYTFPDRVFPVGEKPRKLKCYWDEGTAGIVTALLRYLAISPDEPALLAAWKAIRLDVCRSYAVMPQLFHGLAGFGMALLDAAELVGDTQAYYEAWRTAGGVLRFAVEHPDGIGFPGEQCLRESVDLATGASGVLMFLDRLLRSGRGTKTNANFMLDDLLPLAGTRQ